MNVLFHTTAALGVAVLLTNTKRIEPATTITRIVLSGFAAFTIGLISHGALDYMPHCYPINSKFDVIAGLTMIVLLTWKTNKRYRLVMALSFLGAVFPDLVDLSPGILNKQFGLRLPIGEKIFPWHWHEYSGSVYSGSCKVSMLNHILLLLMVATTCFFRREDMKAMFSKE